MRNVFVTGEAQNSQCFWEVPSVLGNSQGFREFPGSQVLLSTSYFQVKPLPSFFLGSERNLWVQFLTLLFFYFKWMAAILTGEVGQSVTSHVVVDTDRGHVLAPILYLSTAGSTARIWDPWSNLTCVTQGLVHVSIAENAMSVTWRVYHQRATRNGYVWRSSSPDRDHKHTKIIRFVAHDKFLDIFTYSSVRGKL